MIHWVIRITLRITGESPDVLNNRVHWFTRWFESPSESLFKDQCFFWYQLNRTWTWTWTWTWTRTWYLKIQLRKFYHKIHIISITLHHCSPGYSPSPPARGPDRTGSHPTTLDRLFTYGCKKVPTWNGSL